MKAKCSSYILLVLMLSSCESRLSVNSTDQRSKNVDEVDLNKGFEQDANGQVPKPVEKSTKEQTSKEETSATVEDTPPPPPKPKVEFESASIQVSEDGSVSQIKIILDKASDEDITLGWNLGGDAADSKDYTLSTNAPPVISKGMTEVTFNLTSLTDDLPDGSKSLTLELVKPASGIVELGVKSILVVDFKDVDIRLSPSKAYMIPGESLSFSALGGDSNYTYSIVEAVDSTVDASGNLTAANHSEAFTLRVTDGNGYTKDTAVEIISTFESANLGLWLQASSLSLNNNDPIVAWADLTTNSNDFSQAVSGNRPQYKSSSYAGHASVSFDGVDDYLSSSYVPATGSSPRTVVAVYRPQHNSGNSSVLYSWGWNNSYGQCFGLGVSTPYSLDPYTMTFYTNESQGEQGSFWQKAEYNQVHLSILEYDGTDAVHYLNGKTSRSYTKSIDTRNNNPLNIGRFALGGGHFKGDLFELAVFQSSTAGLSREKLECYYGRKFNIKIQNSLECGQAAPVFFADSRTSLKAGSATTLQVSGGTVPLHFEITSGEGTINPSSGEFTAPLTNGFTTVKVTDSFGDDDEITIATHSFSNPLSWLDLDQTSNYSDNDPVEFIRDASGNENHFIQYTSALKPTYKANAQNGKPSLSFTGAHYLQAALKAPIGSADRTFVFVTKNSTEGTILGYGGNEYCGNIFQFYFNTGTNFLSLSRNCGVHASSATISSDAKIIVVQMDSGTLKMFQDGTQVFSDSSPTVSTSTEVSVKLGVSWDRTTGFYTGEILEFMTFDSALDTTDRQAVESYLSGKFAITLP